MFDQTFHQMIKQVALANSSRAAVKLAEPSTRRANSQALRRAAISGFISIGLCALAFGLQAAAAETDVGTLRRSAEAGDAKAQVTLAQMYQSGQGVAQDLKEAVRWYMQAADQGNADAQNNLGWMCAKGHGVSQDYSEALKWYKKASAQEHPKAQYNLGGMYANGEGVKQDNQEAVYWYAKAADHGDLGAQCNLGAMYAKGQGVAQDYRQAAKWYRKAAEQGDAAAQSNLGVLYATGAGVAKDYAEASAWLTIAAQDGDKGSIAKLNAVKGMMTTEQLTQAQKKVVEYLAKIHWGKPVASGTNPPLSPQTGVGGKGPSSDKAPLNPDPKNLGWVKPGTFAMGSPTSEPNRCDDEGPLTQVTLTRGFWMRNYEVTQEEYQSLMATNPSHFIGDVKRPVDSVNWNDATNFCSRLTAQERAAGRLPVGYAYRLPTEAEWEYACRAGTATRFCYGDDPACTSLGGYAWFGNNTFSPIKPSGVSDLVPVLGLYYATQPVGQKLANTWGLYDMHGNVWELCSDWYSDSLPGGNVTDPQGPATGSARVIRGGGGANNGWLCRSAQRSISTGRLQVTGFRPVLAACP
jgi:TPR repeat protein